MSYEFFSQADMKRDRDGKQYVASEFPMSYNPNFLLEMENEIAIRENALKSGQVPEGYQGDYRENLARLKKEFDELRSQSSVDEGSASKDAQKKVWQVASEMLKKELPTREECKQRIVDINREFMRENTPCIDINTASKDGKAAEILAEACQKANVPIVNGKITRYGLSKVVKLSAKAIGENSNVEAYRR